MDQQIIPGHPNSLENILHFITVTIQPACIYKVPLPAEYGILDLIIVLPDTRHKKIFAHYEQIIDIAGIHQNSFRFSLHHVNDLCRKLEKGSLFFNSVCTTANRLYNNGPAQLPLLAEVEIEPVVNKALERFTACHESALSFLQGAQLYKKQSKNRMTAFMLHQCIELSFRGVILALVGIDVRSHKIGELLTHTSRMAPGMNLLFPTDTNWDREFLPWLDSIYCDSRYQEGFTIAKEQLAILYKRAQRVLAAAKRTCGEMVQQFRGADNQSSN